ncbi:MAG: hypothetical protein KTR30_08040 [Saprospiraceae bacterium]|nr:hypothetical protein [Saprospiraceae bacterium]
MQQDDQIEKLIGEYRSIILAKNHLEKLKGRIASTEYDLKLLDRIMTKEYEDVKELEKLSITALFQQVLGNRKEQYEIEKQEYLQSVLKYKEYARTLELMTFEQKILEEKIVKEEKVFEVLNELLLQRDTQISAKYLNLRKQLIQINREVDATLGAQREVHEANIVGVKALGRLDEMIEILQKAHDLEVWAQAVSAPTVRLRVEEYVDEAHEISIQFKVLLLELKDEMEDIVSSSTLKFYSPIQEFMHFHDIYYDRLLSDWVIQQKIVSVLNYFKGLKDNLKLILKTLTALLDTHEKKLTQLQQNKVKVMRANI